MVQNYDGMAISQLGNTQLEKAIANNVCQRFSQRLAAFGNTPSSNTST